MQDTVRIVAIMVLAMATSFAQSSEEWRVVGDMLIPRQQFEAVKLGPTSILVMGGAATAGPMAACEVISIKPFATRPVASMRVPRASFASVAMPDGSIVVLSGWTGSGYACTPIVERYDPTTERWTTLGELQQERFQHVAERLDAHRILVIGGRIGNANVLRSCEVFDVRSGTSTPAAPFPFGTSIGRVARLSDGSVIAFGGRAGGPGSVREETMYRYDAVLNSWRLYGSMKQETYVPSVCVTRADKIVISGGSLAERDNGTFDAIATVQVASAGRVAEQIGDLRDAKILHDVVELRDGRLMAIGGQLSANVPTATCDYIDLANASIVPAPSLNVARSWLRCFVLGSPTDPLSTHVLAIGGLARTGATAVVEELVFGCSNGSSSMLERSRHVMMGGAVQKGDVLQLTPADTFARGAVWSRDKIDLRAPFTSMFAFRVSEGDDRGEKEEVPSEPGADGVVFVIQNQGDNVIGNYGRGIGYDGIKRSVAIEIDTYHNGTINDPNGNHMAIQSKGRGENTSTHGTGATLAFSSAMPVIKGDGTTYYCFIQYQQGRLDAYLNTEPSFRAPVVSKYVDLDSLIGLDPDGKAWVGITSGTGRSFERHDIVLWEVNGCSTDSPVSVSEDAITTGRPDVGFRIVGNDVHVDMASVATGRIDVLDAQGAVVWTTSVTSSINALPASTLASGWYFVRVTTTQGSSMQPWVLVR